MLLYSWLKTAVKAKGSSKALIYRDTYLSWRGLLHRVDRRAREFQGLGVRPGDLVGLMLGNVPDFIILSLALSKLRAAPLPLDPTTSTRELEMLMAIVPLRGLITRPRGGDAPLPASSTTRPGRGRGGKATPESRRRLQGTLLSCAIYATDTPSLPRRKADQIAAVLVTADSAGDPKPVERTAANLAAQAEQLTAALRLTEEDRILLTVPLFNAFGFDVGMVTGLHAQATIYLEDEIAPHRIMKLVREQKVTLLPGSNTLFAELGRIPSARPISHKPLRLLSLGGGLSGPTLESFRKKYGHRPLSCFHTAETGMISIDLRGQSGNTVGKAIPGLEVRVVNTRTGKPAAAGREGALWLRGSSISPLTLSETAVAADGTSVGTRDADGWFRTGDLVSLDRAKRLTLRGREDDLVRVDGKRVALGEVEGCIEACPEVSAAQARLITDPLGGPMVVAKVVLATEHNGVDAETIIDHCARNLAPYKVPRRIEICDTI